MHQMYDKRLFRKKLEYKLLRNNLISNFKKIEDYLKFEKSHDKQRSVDKSYDGRSIRAFMVIANKPSSRVYFSRIHQASCI